MAKTIMVSNEAYSKLKKLKGEHKSFSDIILELSSAKKIKTGKDLEPFIGILKDEDFDMSEIKKGWEKWNKRYA